jgi:serine protease Do
MYNNPNGGYNPYGQNGGNTNGNNGGQYNGQYYHPGQPVTHTVQPPIQPPIVLPVQPVPPAPKKPEQGKKKFKLGANGKLILGIALGFVMAGVMGFAAMATYINSQENNNEYIMPDGTVSSNTNSGAEDAGAGEIIDNFVQSPSVNTTVSGDGLQLLTYAQVATKVKPSVCTIIAFVGDNVYSGGSGVITSKDGYIVTNAHVVTDTKYTLKIKVKTYNDEMYDAKIIGYDSKADIALLKVEATNLIPAEIGDSTKLVEGSEVVAIGTPLDEAYAGSVTNGIISGVNRVLDGSDTAIKYLQTNAAINPGNSGGALVNMYGQVIGINTAKIMAEGYEGIGFAIPMNAIIDILAELKENGFVVRPALGILCATLTESNAALFGVESGVRITGIYDGSDLKGKAQIYDIIIALNGTRVTDQNQLQTLLADKKVGDTVTLTLYRAKSQTSEAKTFDVKVKLVGDNTLNDTASQNNGNDDGNDGYYDDFKDFFGMWP